MTYTWLVTGTTSGVGEALVREILARGDKVIASGRKVEERLGSRIAQSDNLAFLELDVTWDQTKINALMQEAWDKFGSIDVLVNNAGCTAFSSAEEADDAYVEKMFQVNVFGQMRVTRAILPLLRAQGHGYIAFVSSSSASAPVPFMSHYGSSKAALSAYVEALHKETAPLGIKCVAIESGGMPTMLGQPREEGAQAFVQPAFDGYLPLFGELMQCFAQGGLDAMPGDVNKVASVIVDIVKREGVAKGRPWSVRVPLGSDGWGQATQKCNEYLQVADEWKEVSFGTNRDGVDVNAANVVRKFTTMIEEK